MRSRETEFCVCERERYFTTRVIARETYEVTQDISRGESVCERHTREQWRNMRPWETEFVFVCEKEIFKRKSRSFSYLRSKRQLCVRGGVRVAHRGIVERNETPGDKVLCLCERKRFHMENHS